MESWEVLQRAIPRTASGRVAQLLNISADWVRKWRREPDSEDAPTATGQRSLLDRICDLIDAVFLINPNGVPLIVNYIESHYRKLLRVHTKSLATLESRVECTADLLTQATEAINSMNLEGCTIDTYQQLVELRIATDEAIRHCETTMNKQEESDA